MYSRRGGMKEEREREAEEERGYAFDGELVLLW